VSEQHLGAALRCPGCKKPFQTRAAAPSPPPGLCRLDVGAATSKGRVRDRNEDSLLVQRLNWIHQDQRNELALLVVADGMGGRAGGDRASGVVVRTMGHLLTPLLSGILSGTYEQATANDLANAVESALQEANRMVRRQSHGDAACRGMAATAVVALVRNGLAVVGHVGDARAYHVRAGKLTQLTRDQTLVSRMVELGQLTEKEALRHPSRNEVAQAVGLRPELTPGRSQVQLTRGDWLLLACDGLHTEVEDKVLEETIRRSPASGVQLAEQLVALADRHGGSDNTSVIAAYCF
jgi:protein phosphatase